MSPPDYRAGTLILTLQDQLTEAQAAYHKLLTGTAAVEFKDQNGESVRYTVANRAALAAYIRDLQRQIDGDLTNLAPIRLFF